MDKHMARWALSLAVVGLIGCGSGGGAAPGDGAGAAGATEIGGSGEAGQAGGGVLAGNTGEAGQAGAGTQAGGIEATGGTTKTGGSPGTAGVGGTSASKPTGSTATGGKTASTTGTGVASAYIDAINAVRAAVSKPANYTGTWAPLPNVVWSDTVAASAQAWADNLATTQNCKLQHESQNTYGENLAMGTNLTPKQAVDMWASEKNLYTWSPTYSMADFNAGSGHYTQLVWRKSTQVGCGSATCARSVVVSCRFLPPGNFMGQAVF